MKAKDLYRLRLNGASLAKPQQPGKAERRQVAMELSKSRFPGGGAGAIAVGTLCIFLATSLSCRAPTSARPTPEAPVAKNIVVMISDGCGYNHIDAASLFQHGEVGTQVYESFPFKRAITTYSADGDGYDPERAWKQFDYVKQGTTDSAAAATAMSTGVKTRNRAIGVDVSGKPLKHALERAEELGKATGVVTSVYLSGGTPAGFVAHSVSRDSYEAISREMILSSAVDVIMGTGHPWFDNDGKPLETAKSFQYVGGQETWEGLQAGRVGADADRDGCPDRWKLIQTRHEFQALAVGPTPKRIIGVPRVHLTLQQSRSGKDDSVTNDVPWEAPLIDTVPTLTEMARAALNVLDDDPDGFFLMIEGGAVDWASHACQSGRMIEEQIDFNNAVGAVVAWVEQNSNWDETLVIVTGDHECGYLTGPDSDPAWSPLSGNGPGRLPGMEWHGGGHTNSLIPLFVRGTAARALLSGVREKRDPVRGAYLDNTDVGRLIRAALE